MMFLDRISAQKLHETGHFVSIAIFFSSTFFKVVVFLFWELEAN